MGRGGGGGGGGRVERAISGLTTSQKTHRLSAIRAVKAGRPRAALWRHC